MYFVFVLNINAANAYKCHATQVWSPQSIELVRKTERVQRRASKFILKLPFTCTESYKDRLMSINLLPVSYWHEYLDLMFFFKAINGIITVAKEILPKRSIPSRPTRSSSNNSVISYRPRRCKTATYQRSFFIRATRTWNSLPEHLRLDNLSLTLFKKSLLEYYHNALVSCYDVDDHIAQSNRCRSLLLLDELVDFFSSVICH